MPSIDGLHKCILAGSQNMYIPSTSKSPSRSSSPSVETSE